MGLTKPERIIMLELDMVIFSPVRVTVPRRMLKASAKKILKGPRSRVQHLAAMFLLGTPYWVCERERQQEFSKHIWFCMGWRAPENLAKKIAEEACSIILQSQSTGIADQYQTVRELHISLFPKVISWMKGQEIISLERVEFSAHLSRRLAEDEFWKEHPVWRDRV